MQTRRLREDERAADKIIVIALASLLTVSVLSALAYMSLDDDESNEELVGIVDVDESNDEDEDDGWLEAHNHSTNFDGGKRRNGFGVKEAQKRHRTDMISSSSAAAERSQRIKKVMQPNTSL